MKLTFLVLTLWLLAVPYYKTSQCVASLTPWRYHEQCCCIIIVAHKNTSNKLGSLYVNINNQTKIFFLIAPPLQGPLIYKWRRDWSWSIIQVTQPHNDKVLYACRMAFSQSLEKSLDGIKDMEVTQTKKRSSSNACLTIVEKTKNKTNTQGKTFPLWLGFKAMNALNASQGLAKESHRSVSELVKSDMYEDEALECQDCIPAYPYVPQELWPNKYIIEEQNFHFIQIPSEIEVFEGFAMDYHVALFFDLEEMVV